MSKPYYTDTDPREAEEFAWGVISQCETVEEARTACFSNALVRSRFLDLIDLWVETGTHPHGLSEFPV